MTSAVAQQHTRLTFVPPLDSGGLNRTQFFDISADGTTAVGITRDRAAVWTEESGLAYLPTVPGATQSTAWAVSEHGNHIALTITMNLRNIPYKYSNGMYIIQPAVVGNVAGDACGISGDGSTVVGMLSSETAGRPARWVQNSAAALVAVGDGYAFGASRDGSVIVGHVAYKAIRWTASTGTRYLSMGSLASTETSVAYNISANGNTIVGTAGSNAAIWIGNNAPILVPTSPSASGGSGFLACSTDGSVVAGTWNGKPALWTQTSGVRSIEQILFSRGITNVVGSVDHISGVSGDGVRFVGRGAERLFDGQVRQAAIILDLPICPGDFNRDYFVDLFDYLDFVAAFASTDPSTDLNTDGVIDFFDYLDFVDRFQGPC